MCRAGRDVWGGGGGGGWGIFSFGFSDNCEIGLLQKTFYNIAREPILFELKKKKDPI